MYALMVTSVTVILCRRYASVDALAAEAVTLTDKKGASYWNVCAMIAQGCAIALNGNASNAVQVLGSGTATLRSMGSTTTLPFFLSYLARAHAELGKFDDAWCCIDEASTAAETTKERWWESDNPWNRRRNRADGARAGREKSGRIARGRA